MPFVSQAQRRKFYADPELRRYAPEFEAATPKGQKLPQRARRRRVTSQKRGRS